jgi:hypothetical protein
MLRRQDGVEFPLFRQLLIQALGILAQYADLGPQGFPLVMNYSYMYKNSLQILYKG